MHRFVAHKVWTVVLERLLRDETVVGFGNSEFNVIDRICDCLEVCIRLPFVVFFWLLITWNIWRARNDLVFL